MRYTPVRPINFERLERHQRVTTSQSAVPRNLVVIMLLSLHSILGAPIYPACSPHFSTRGMNFRHMPYIQGYFYRWLVLTRLVKKARYALDQREGNTRNYRSLRFRSIVVRLFGLARSKWICREISKRKKFNNFVNHCDQFSYYLV